MQSSRRHFFQDCSVGIGAIALGTLLGDDSSQGATTQTGGAMQPKSSMIAPKAKNVIYLFMAGGPTQLELFDYKPLLTEYNGQKPPA